MFSMKGRVAVVTGGAGLLAEIYARALAESGVAVVLADVEYERCQERVAALEASGAAACAVRCDVTDPENWRQLLREVLSRFGRVDILVNNAGVTNRSRTGRFDAAFDAFPLEDWQGILDVNLTGTFLGCQAVGAVMVEQGSGSIVNIASQYALVSPHHRIYEGTGITQPAAYSVSKAGVLALTRYLAALWAVHGVRVNAITPGGMFDGQEGEFVERFRVLNPMRRMGLPSELAGALVYLASDASSYCTGHNLVVDGGWTVW
jgi:NAD(P)-dependent dehydrogenase (short-subunit alcohol dehydrogenase family)